jgi:hypothetical protein
MNQVYSISSPIASSCLNGRTDMPSTVAKKPPSTSLSGFFKKSLIPLKKLSRRELSDSTASTAASDISDCFVEDEQEQENLIVHLIPAKKSVLFAPRASIRSILTRKDITLEEKRAAWYCSAEYDQISKQCFKQVLTLERGETLKDIKYCARGLESYTRQAAELKHRNRQMAHAAVLHYPAGRGTAQRYHNVSSSCQERASKVGLQDQIAAQDHRCGTRKCLLSIPLARFFL